MWRSAPLIAAKEVRPFTDKQIELVQTFADQAVIAIENVRLFEEVQARTRELRSRSNTRLRRSEVLNVISRSPSKLQPVLDAIVETAGRLCQSEYALRHRLQDGNYPWPAADDCRSGVAIYCAITQSLGSRLRCRAGRARAAHGPCPDILADPEYIGSRPEAGIPHDPRRSPAS